MVRHMNPSCWCPEDQGNAIREFGKGLNGADVPAGAGEPDPLQRLEVPREEPWLSRG